MTEHDALTLMALKLRKDRFPSHRIFDIDVLNAGRERFASDWSSLREGRGFGYAPLVSMSLGRLAKQGFVRRGERCEEKGQTFFEWRITEEGDELAAEMLGVSSASSGGA